MMKPTKTIADIDMVELRRLIDKGEEPAGDRIDQAEWEFCYTVATGPDKMRIILDELERLQKLTYRLI